VLSVAIMAHPKRHKFVADLAPRLCGSEVVWDTDDDRWETGSRAMLAYDEQADWHLVVQDDVIPCDGFLAAVARALGAVPADQPVASFYTGRTRPYSEHVRRAVDSAIKGGYTWMAMRGPLWGPAVAVRTGVIREMVAAADQLGNVPNYDMRMSEFFHARGDVCWYSIPSLVNHRVGVENPSLVPGRGAGEGRVAYHFHQGDAAQLEWTEEAWLPGDPSEWWWEDFTCTRCMARCSSLVDAITHCRNLHGLGKVDLLATTPHHKAKMEALYRELPGAIRGTLWLGSEAGVSSLPHQRIPTAGGRTALQDGPYVVCGALRDLKRIGNRSGWSLDGQAN
jgi:hypothetical protein